MVFKTVGLLAVLLCIAEARPGVDFVLRAITDIDLAIIAGSNAPVGAWPWQLSQQRRRPTGEFSHSCGASLLTSRYALSAAHCVDGSSPDTLRVVAGLHNRDDETGSQATNVISYKMHEEYNTCSPRGASYCNDIAILTFETPIQVGGNVQLATLPKDNSDDFAEQSCYITGWGRSSSSNVLPTILQQADITPISVADCQTQFGTGVWEKQICVYDSSNKSGACNGDSGGPVNCPSGDGHVVTGVASFVASLFGNCMPRFPSVYTRVSSYLDWIAVNTP